MSCYFPRWGTMLWVLFLLQFMFCMAGSCFVEERIALMRIRSSLLETKSYGEDIETWGRSDNCCTWKRVICNDNARVSRLNLDFVHFYSGPRPIYENESQAYPVGERGFWNLNFTIFSSFHELQLLDLNWNSACLRNFEGLQGLSKLRNINLSRNILIGNNVLESVLASLSQLPSLEYLDLSQTDLQGHIPKIDLSRSPNNLRELRLGSNQLNGSIPSSLFQLPCLEYLDLSGNLLHHIPIDLPRSQKNLRELRLGSNKLNGSIPASLFELPCLEYLDLSGNLLQHIPIDLPRSQKNLRELHLGSNKLNGSIPASLFELPCLEYLDLSWNLFQGPIPKISLSRTLKNLRKLYLGYNQLSGSIPASLFELPCLEYLELPGNLLQGHIPMTDISRNLKKLRELHLHSNQLNGSIPAFLFELPRLEYLGLSDNLLQGLPTSPTLNFSSSLQTIRLSKNNLNGTFDFFWLRNCANITIVDLSENADLAIDVKFRGSVPPFKLEALMLSGCNLDNSIILGPNFLGTQRNLHLLDLSNNNLKGSCPTWIIENHETLVYLNLANNSLEGSLFDLMWKHQYGLFNLNISMNRFVGKLPTNMSTVFPGLDALDTSYNSISGDLPPSLCEIESLAFIDLSNNKLTGQVPACLFTTVQTLMLSNNSLEGPILSGASDLSLFGIYLASNKFEGEIPNNLSSYSLEVMDLHDNKLSGKLDMSSWKLSSLKVLSVASNNLTGEIYPDICQLTSLQFLDMSNNNFSGSIPNCQLTLKFLNMSSNTLSGSPGGFLNYSNVVALDLRYNQFDGVLDWIQCLSQIKMLLLGWNMFEGQISRSLCHLHPLNIIDLSHNNLSGPLPPCIGSISFGHYKDDLDFWSSPVSTRGGQALPSFGAQLDEFIEEVFYKSPETYDLPSFTFSTKGSRYTYGRSFFNLMFGIDLSANMLSGEIPWEIGNLSYVKSLNLSHNSITGPIPAAMANMRAIESLDLSHNKLSGPIPLQMTQMSSLEVFFVDYNNLSGCIPNSGQLGLFDAESYLGNTNLHNSSQGDLCFPVPVPVKEEEAGEASDDPILYIISAASYVFSFWATTAFLFCHPFGQRVVLQI